MTGRVELNPGEWFMIGDPTILVEESESIIAMTGKLGMAEDRIAHMLTFTGKRNNRDEKMTVTLLFDPKDSNELVIMMSESLNHLVKHLESLKGEIDDG